MFVRGVETPATFGACAQWSDSSGWSAGTKAGIMRMTMSSMDAFRDWFFWTWKVIDILLLKVNFKKSQFFLG